MYLSEKPRPIDFYKGDRDMVIEVPHHHHHQNNIILNNNESSGGEDQQNETNSNKAPKKRAETWVQDETRFLIGFRREVDAQFNTSKSNRHLWEGISAKMRDKGFDRTASMCTDKWRNLLKEFKKASKDRGGSSAGSAVSAKMSYYKELEELLRDRAKNGGSGGGVGYKSPTGSSKVDMYIQFSDHKGSNSPGNCFACRKMFFFWWVLFWDFD